MLCDITVEWLAEKVVFDMTYNVFSGMSNPTMIISTRNCKI